ncbi:U-box domain-containing protein 35 isoform X2 [Beta vulgaris subsp. vulgaris]|uniref:U-box domain-containing protein 35 isoform X2 n=1 Tax=Beta vulgaris subsp. vulgaris TaxID=3555 RepID=UPI002036D547|nr:U-box domain-containing protein 35 isoform X2 [Beta vulgaris subsp. vulgaris]
MAENKAADQSKLIVGVALTGSRKSKYILRWALEKFLPEGNVSFKLLHVYPKITIVPTPMGTWLPVAQVREDVVTGYRQETEWKKQKKIVPYQRSLKAQKIKSDIVILESDDIAMAISLEVSRQSLRHLVIGVSSASIFSMRSLSLMRGDDLSQVISESAPSFCSVYVVGDGKLQQLRPADSEQNVISMEDTSNLSSTSTDSSSSSSSLTIGRLLKNKPSSPRYGSATAASDSSTSTSHPKQPDTLPRNAAGTKTLARETLELKHYTFKDTNIKFGNSSTLSQSSSSGDSGSWVSDRTSPGGSLIGTQSDGPSPVGTPPPRSFLSNLHTGAAFTGTHTAVSFMNTPPAVSPVGTPPTSSYLSTPPSGSRAGTPPGGSYAGTHAGTPPGGSYAGTPIGTPPGGSYVGTPIGTPPGGSFVGTPPSVSFLGIPSGSERGTSKNQISELEKLRIELRHIEKMYELTQNSSIDERLNEISKERLEEALKLKEGKGKDITSTEKNKLKNKANNKDAQEVEESKNKLKELFASPAVQYQKFTWEEIMEATSSLSDEFKIGMGAFGTVYKCKLHHTTVAIKVLHCKDSVTNKQFVQELEILSTIRHPHLLLLLGAVPEESCLVYEYMDEGSLDDRLFRKTNKPALPWYDRFRICSEVAGALAFLHSTKPRPIIHRDLKPANILLDHHLVSKIGDAGLGTMINVEPNNQSLKTIYKETSPVGTLCYIDPEYQRTGRVSTKSDIYALGVVILQLLTAKPAVGIAYMIEDAIDEGTLTEILDPEAGEWPEKETLELAMLGLQCSELRGRDRPDLKERVLPALERFKEVADRARESASNALTATPTHFMCPILKDFMEDPYVAADGYTYDRKAIEQWLTENDTSPTTNQPLPHKFIMPNTSLLEAITQWKSKKSPN